MFNRLKVIALFAGGSTRKRHRRQAGLLQEAHPDLLAMEPLTELVVCRP
jgi:hypothetical protein